MGIIIVEHAIVREPGKIYYIDKDGNLVEADSHQTKYKKIKEEKKE